MIRKINRKLLIILSPGIIVLILLLGYFTFQSSPSSDIYSVQTFRVSDGWGYQITINNREFIYQPYIPGIPGKKTFPDKKTAVRAGKIVKAKLHSNKLPYLTRDDLRKIGLDSLGNSE